MKIHRSSVLSRENLTCVSDGSPTDGRMLRLEYKAMRCNGSEARRQGQPYDWFNLDEMGSLINSEEFAGTLKEARVRFRMAFSSDHQKERERLIAEHQPLFRSGLRRSSGLRQGDAFVTRTEIDFHVTVRGLSELSTTAETLSLQPQDGILVSPADFLRSLRHPRPYMRMGCKSQQQVASMI